MKKICAAILAGGESRRMGQDKALLAIRGETLLTRTARIARVVCDPVLVIGREMPENWPLPDVVFRTDATPGQGPLGGLQTALQHANTPVLLLACDLPLLDADAIHWLATQWQNSLPNTLGLVTRRESAAHGEPLFALYSPALLPRIAEFLHSGRRSLHALIQAGGFVSLELPEAIAAKLTNVNTPDEWRAATGS